MIPLKILFYTIATVIILAYVITWLIVLHKVLRKKTFYAWICESILYRHNLDKVKWLSHEDKILLYTTWICHGHWSLDYWFGKGINKYLENYIDETEIQKDSTLIT